MVICSQYALLPKRGEKVMDIKQLNSAKKGSSPFLLTFSSANTLSIKVLKNYTLVLDSNLLERSKTL